MNPEGLFGSYKPAGLNQIDSNRQQAFEETVVKQILRSAGVRYPSLGDRARLGFSRMSFAWFQAAYTFPLMLGASRVPFMQKVGLSEVFGKGFTRLPFFQEYRKWLASEDYDDTAVPVGFIFNCPRADGASKLILHNMVDHNSFSNPALWREHDTRIVRPYGNPLVIYVIEPFSSFLAQLDPWCAKE